MVLIGREVTCVRGDMGLSQAMREELESLVASPPVEPERATRRMGGSWRCPADGQEMHESDGQLRCATCGRFVPFKTLYRFMEIHPHRKEL